MWYTVGKEGGGKGQTNAAWPCFSLSKTGKWPGHPLATLHNDYVSYHMIASYC